MDKNTLQQVGEWAQSRVASGEEPPWTYHKLKLFAEIANDLASGMDAITSFDESGRELMSDKDGPSEGNIVQIDEFRAYRSNGDLVLPS